MEIPGYYFVSAILKQDPEKLKYFVETPETKRLRKLAESRPKNLLVDCKESLEHKSNAVQYLGQREIGLGIPNNRAFLVGQIGPELQNEAINLNLFGNITDFNIDSKGIMLVGMANGSLLIISKRMVSVAHKFSSQISSICRAPGSENYLVTTLGNSRNGGGVYLFNAISMRSQRLVQTRDTLWQTAVEYQTNSTSIGASSKIKILDLASGRLKTEFGTKYQSDIFTQVWLSPTLLANGCRNGSILVYDIRSKRLIKENKANAPISTFKYYRNNLYYSCINGSIRNWNLQGPSTFQASVENSIKPVDFEIISDSILVAAGDLGICSAFSLDNQMIINQVSIPKGRSIIKDFEEGDYDGFWISSETTINHRPINNVLYRSFI